MAPHTPMVAPRAPVNAQPTHFVTPPRTLMPSPGLMNPTTSQRGQGTQSMASNVAYINQPTQLTAPTTPMAARRTHVNAQPTHFATPPRTLLPSPRFMDPTTSQTGQGTHFMASNMAYDNQPTQLVDATTLMQSAISQTGHGTHFMGPNMAHTNQPTQWTALTTPMEPAISETGQDAQIMVLNTPVKPSNMPGGNPWPSPSSSTNSPYGNTSSTQPGINEGALGQQIGDDILPQGFQGYMSDDNIWNEEFRVGGPQLCALPATTSLFDEGSHYYSLAWDGDLLNRVYRMAHRFNIEPIEAMLVTRQSEWGLMPAPIVTVLIFANRKDMDDSWVQCAQLIRKYLTTKVMEPSISVEIADPRAFPWKGPDFALPMSSS